MEEKKVMRKRTLARERALQILYQHEMNPDSNSFDETLQSYWEENPEPSAEVREFAEALVRGTLEHLNGIDETIRRAAEHWELERMAVVDRNILRFAVYELCHCSDIPPKVTINEAVNLAKKFSQSESGKFVNGILDKISHSVKPPAP